MNFYYWLGYHLSSLVSRLIFHFRVAHRECMIQSGSAILAMNAGLANHVASGGSNPTLSRRARISAGTIRLSVGLEDPDDLCWDLARGLAAAREAVASA